MGQYSDFSYQTPSVKPDSAIDPHKRDNGHLRHSCMGKSKEVTWHPHV